MPYAIRATTQTYAGTRPTTYYLDWDGASYPEPVAFPNRAAAQAVLDTADDGGYVLRHGEHSPPVYKIIRI